MVRRVDTQLKEFPFEELSKAHTMTVDNGLHQRSQKNRNPFYFDYIPDEPWATMDSLEDIDAILIQELGTTLDDLH